MSGDFTYKAIIDYGKRPCANPRCGRLNGSLDSELCYRCRFRKYPIKAKSAGTKKLRSDYQ
jgi:hypothetical protein